MWFVTRVFFRDGKKNSSIEEFPVTNKVQEKAVWKRYWSILASDVDSTAIEYELVQIVRDDGVTLASEKVVDNRSQAEE